MRFWEWTDTRARRTRRDTRAAAKRDEIMTSDDEDFPLSDFAAQNSGQLQDMTSLYDHFYKALWKLLLSVNGADSQTAQGARGHNGGGAGEKKTRGPSFALAFAGCSRGDGASTMAFNFASAFAANSSKSVLLVDGNLRDPILHHQFHVEKEAGLADVVEGNTAIDDAITELTFRRYYFLRAGQNVMNPVTLYESGKFLAVMQKLRERYDLIIFDCPPVPGSPETALLASRMDGLVMVLQAEKTRWEVARSVKWDLEGAGVRLLGAVINRQRRVIPETIYRML